MLTHYIFVRKDLPIGVLAAMITHAAGESAALYQDHYDGRFRGATAVVLEAKNEDHLKAIESYLQSNDIQYVAVHETGGPYNGQFMAIGLVPTEREFVAPKLTEFQTLKSCLDNGVPLTVDSLNPNENQINKDSPTAAKFRGEGRMGLNCNIPTIIGSF